MKIEKKAWPEFFEQVLGGNKNFDVRLADFACEPGDTLVLKEWDPKTQQYTGREIEKKITYILKTKQLTVWSQQDIEKYGYQVLGLQ